MAGSHKYQMRNWINLVESFGSTTHLYHGLSIDSMWLVIRHGALDPDINGFGHAGPEGVCLSRNIQVAKGHAESQTENLAYSFFEYFDLGPRPKELTGVVFEFRRDKITQEIVPFDDFAGWGDDSGEGQEEEERVMGQLPLTALTGIYVDPAALHMFLDYATKAFKAGGTGYGDEFRAIIQGVLKDPRLKKM
jgi:hypothetical protein